MIRIAVCGAHMSGLTEFSPPRPGLVRSAFGAAVAAEVLALPARGLGVDAIPPPLGIGTIAREDGDAVRGFLRESYAAAADRDITDLGGWCVYVRRGAR